MIPKKIHYCWFWNGEKTKLTKKCIASWRKYCPDYEIIEWNEGNFDVNINPYVKMCYEQKKYAFLTDYLRLLVVLEHGGLYFDTDVEIVKNFDNLLDAGAFFGFETEQYINTGEGFGAEAGNLVIAQMLKEYDEYLDGKHGMKGCPLLNTEALLKLGLKQNGQLQVIENSIIYPPDYFNPYEDSTGVLSKTKNTYSIHWYGKSWLDKKTVLRSKISRPFHRIFGVYFLKKIKGDRG